MVSRNESMADIPGTAQDNLPGLETAQEKREPADTAMTESATATTEGGLGSRAQSLRRPLDFSGVTLVMALSAASHSALQSVASITSGLSSGVKCN